MEDDGCSTGKGFGAVVVACDSRRMDAHSHYRCFACGRFADEISTFEGPTAEEAGQCERWLIGVLDVHEGGPCRAAVACWPCFWKTDPDLWIRPATWDALKPVVPFERLPLFDHDRSDGKDPEDPATYAWPL